MKKILMLAVTAATLLASCKKDQTLQPEEKLNLKLEKKVQVNIPTDPNDPGSGYDDGIELGFKDANHFLAQAGFFTTTWQIIYDPGNGWTVDSHGLDTFQWHGLPARDNYLSWHTIYQQSLLTAIGNESIAYYRERYKGQQLGASIATSKALTTESSIPPTF